MSHDKAIETGKEKRKQYRGSKNFDYSCRNHGSCSWCQGNRMHKHTKKECSCNEQENDIESQDIDT